MPATASPPGVMVTVAVSFSGIGRLMVAVTVAVPPSSAMLDDEGLEKVTVLSLAGMVMVCRLRV